MSAVASDSLPSLQPDSPKTICEENVLTKFDFSIFGVWGERVDYSNGFKNTIF